MEIILKPIGYVRTKFTDDEVKEHHPHGVEAEIEILKEYSEALDGIDGFSHIILIFFMHKVTDEQKATLKARHRRLIKLGFRLEELPLVGVFCLDSPHRPNPVGLTIVKLLERRGCILKVEGVDAFDGTPILDIKPYTPDRCIRNIELPPWLTTLMEELKERGISIEKTYTYL
ncbi:tRNA (N6-threonylcarbamoyladenosine(37)-N6)-methyltransferase TrmO [Candidatus Bathyarchaeota archaeon]|nr:tRNA (N6-threonylcarbamoyladenosine(37)-N6)-methyltransferase TrmO [Candidatus Bathyarchaeota archaeon]